MSLRMVAGVLSSWPARLSVLAFFAALVVSPSCAYAARNATIVIDANTGKVLQQSNPDSARYPASITKVMTLYLLFEQMEKGRFTLDSKLKVSGYAASRPPSKLGLRPGSDIRVRDAILAMVTRSANDVAATIAENIAGSESAFAAMMTKKARQLGMSNTVYRNASGLPNPGQVTSARDLALLGRSLYERFPAYSKYFSARYYNYRGRSIANHNKLLGRVAGVDGIKTGYTNASGYNLLTSVRHKGRHLIAVVMGGSTGRQRDATMRVLIATYLPKASAKKIPDKQLLARIFDKAPKNMTVALNEKDKMKPAKNDAFAQAVEAIEAASDETTLVALAPVAPLKKDLNAIVAPALAAAEEGDGGDDSEDGENDNEQIEADAPQAGTQHLVADRLRMEWNTGAQPQLSPKEVVASAVHPDDAAEDEAMAAEPVASIAPEGKRETVSGWIIQIAATNSESQALNLLSEAAQKLKLANLQPFTERVEKGAATLYRARFGGFAERKVAEAACSALKRQSYSCMTLRL